MIQLSKEFRENRASGGANAGAGSWREGYEGGVKGEGDMAGKVNESEGTMGQEGCWAVGLNKQLTYSSSWWVEYRSSRDPRGTFCGPNFSFYIKKN